MTGNITFQSKALHDAFMQGIPPGVQIRCPSCGCQSAKIGDAPISTMSVYAMHCAECDTMSHASSFRDLLRPWAYYDETTYWCTYQTAPQLGSETKMVKAYRLDAVSDGFWLNDRGELDPGSGAVRWIPPGRIIHVDKSTEEKQGLYDERS